MTNIETLLDELEAALSDRHEPIDAVMLAHARALAAAVGDRPLDSQLHMQLGKALAQLRQTADTFAVVNSGIQNLFWRLAAPCDHVGHHWTRAPGFGFNVICETCD